MSSAHNVSKTKSHTNQMIQATLAYHKRGETAHGGGGAPGGTSGNDPSGLMKKRKSSIFSSKSKSLTNNVSKKSQSHHLFENPSHNFLNSNLFFAICI